MRKLVVLLSLFFSVSVTAQTVQKGKLSVTVANDQQQSLENVTV